MYDVTIRIAETLEVVAKGRGGTWEQAAFDGYDRFARSEGRPRRYLAQVLKEMSPKKRVVRFGYLGSGVRDVNFDPEVVVELDGPA